MKSFVRVVEVVIIGIAKTRVGLVYEYDNT